MKKRIIFILTVFMVSGYLAANTNSKPVAIVLEVDGKALVRPFNKDYTNYLKIGIELFNGDTITTEKSSTVVLLFPDDTTILLRENNELTFNDIKSKSGITKFLKGFWDIVTSKFQDSEQSVLDSNLVGSIRGSSKSEILLEDKKLSSAEKDQLNDQLIFIENNIDNKYSILFYKSVKLEEFGQQIRAEKSLLAAIDIDPENENSYNLLIDIYTQNNLLEKIEDIKELKTDKSW